MELTWCYQQCQHACMQIAALQSSAAHSKCIHAAVSACCVSWESNPVCTDGTGLVVTPPSEEEMLLWGIPCVSQVPVACRVMKFIILAAYPHAEAMVGCEFFWCVFPLQEGKNKVSLLLFLPSPSCCCPHSCPFPFLSAVCHVGGCSYLCVQLGG